MKDKQTETVAIVCIIKQRLCMTDNNKHNRRHGFVCESIKCKTTDKYRWAPRAELSKASAPMGDVAQWNVRKLRHSFLTVRTKLLLQTDDNISTAAWFSSQLYVAIDWLWWGETVSLNCGYQRVYCTSPGWYVSMESHGGDDVGWDNSWPVHQSSLAVLPADIWKVREMDEGLRILPMSIWDTSRDLQHAIKSYDMGPPALLPIREEGVLWIL
jgi:hypothetical protein